MRHILTRSIIYLMNYWKTLIIKLIQAVYDSYPKTKVIDQYKITFLEISIYKDFYQ